MTYWTIADNWAKHIHKYITDIIVTVISQKIVKTPCLCKSERHYPLWNILLSLTDQKMLLKKTHINIEMYVCIHV